MSELSNDASISVPRLSKKINVNSSVVYSRIKRLVKRKLIERFTIVVNDAELGYNVKALTGINMDTKKRDHIIEELFDKGLKYMLFSHNKKMGSAKGAVLLAEMLYKKGKI